VKEKMKNDFPFRYSLCSSQLILQDPEVRLNASSFPPEWIEAKKILEKIKRKITIERLSTFAEKVFVGARVKRLFVGEGCGIPYLMPDDVFMFPLKPRKWVRKETQDIENWWVEPFTILITQSGAAGRCLIVNKHFKDKLVSPNMIRVVPNSKGKGIIGFIYAFLNTTIGQTFLLKEQYGITVKHIEPDHVSNIPLPLLPESDIKEINEKILKAHKLREEAQEQLFKAEKIFFEELELPLLDENAINYFGGENGRLVKAFTLFSNEFLTTQIRLNSYSYLPISRYARKILTERKKRFDLKKLGDPEVTQKVFTPPRFKRIYVKNEKDGIPLLQGSHIPLLKYFDIKLIWNKMKNLSEYVIKRNWILVTCSGTIGRVFLVSKFCDGWAATNHMTRIIPSEKVNAGYLTVFLQSPYGVSQLQALMYGGVVEEFGEAGELVGEILVPIPSKLTQEKIGNLVIEAYEKKDQANLIENEAIKLLENKLKELAR
jgi:type I restriction enzyme S subunit